MRAIVAGALVVALVSVGVAVVAWLRMRAAERDATTARNQAAAAERRATDAEAQAREAQGRVEAVSGELAGVNAQLADHEQRLRDTERRLLTAEHDAVTGLWLRGAFVHRARAAMTAGGETGRPVAVLVGDCDDFKKVNDTHGHGVGDAVLREIGERLTVFFGPRAMACRWGGDEFLVLLDAVPDAGHLDRLAGVIGAPIAVRGRAVRVTMSVGVVPLDDARSFDSFVRDADDRMYAAKRARRATGNTRAEDRHADAVVLQMPVRHTAPA